MCCTRHHGRARTCVLSGSWALLLVGRVSAVSAPLIAGSLTEGDDYAKIRVLALSHRVPARSVQPPEMTSYRKALRNAAQRLSKTRRDTPARGIVMSKPWNATGTSSTSHGTPAAVKRSA